VVADLDGDRQRARVRIAAGLSVEDVIDRFAAEIEHRVVLTWDRGRNELVQREEERLGGLVLAERTSRPQAGPETVAALVERIRQDRLRTLSWDDTTLALRERVGYLHRTVGPPWPDWGDSALLSTLGDWLAPALGGLTSWAEVQGLRLSTILRAGLDPSVGYRLDELAPTSITLSNGRTLTVRYGDDGPVVSARPQRLYGTRSHPQIAGNPVIVEVLSPADRPIQVTRDLPGFWAGSWAAVRKDMAGRYPKHFWPTDPANEQPR
jgi:ATP-dependent helicase HrpB